MSVQNVDNQLMKKDNPLSELKSVTWKLKSVTWRSLYDQGYKIRYIHEQSSITELQNLPGTDLDTVNNTDWNGLISYRKNKTITDDNKKYVLLYKSVELYTADKPQDLLNWTATHVINLPLKSGYLADYLLHQNENKHLSLNQQKKLAKRLQRYTKQDSFIIDLTGLKSVNNIQALEMLKHGSAVRFLNLINSINPVIKYILCFNISSNNNTTGNILIPLARQNLNLIQQHVDCKIDRNELLSVDVPEKIDLGCFTDLNIRDLLHTILINASIID